MITPSQLKLITEPRLEILRWLVEYRYGTSRQIWGELQPHKDYHHTLGDLAKLRELGLVKSFRYQPERGGGSQLCWLLLRDGAEVAGANYGNHYLREPSRKQIEFRELELLLTRTVSRTGYTLIKPQIYSRERPAPPKTPQYYSLVEGVRALQYQRKLQKTRYSANNRAGSNDYDDEVYQIVPPYRANDYVASYGSPLVTMVVLILAPFDAGEKFWKSRLEEYRRLLKEKVPVVAVFASEPQARSWQELLKQGGFKLTIIERVEKLLLSLAQEGVG